MDQETDHRLGVVELKQGLRDARCVKCHSELRAWFKVARDLKWLATMAVILAIILAIICVLLVATN